MKYQKIIIIGAPRSGTNMLRDVLCKIHGVVTWPCDEINYIWRHGNVFHDSDEFSAAEARDEVISFIQKKFDKEAVRQNARVLVEKTCANSLRVSFVDKVVPDAKYIFLYRNGYDALSSAGKRWVSSMDVGYILKKARYVPIIDFPVYAIQFLYHHIFRWFSKEKRLASWGPKWRGMQEDLEKYDLPHICARQWSVCVKTSIHQLAKLSPDKVMSISYEEFVSDPTVHLRKITKFMGLDCNDTELRHAVSDVCSLMIGKGQKDIANQSATLRSIIDPQLKALGYTKFRGD